MLREFVPTRQIAGEPRRRWFASPSSDLIVWLRDDDSVSGFQLCYDKKDEEHALTWTEGQGFSHMRVDSGGSALAAGRGTPFLVANGVFDARRILQLFQADNKLVPKPFTAIVCAKLEELAKDMDAIKRQVGPMNEKLPDSVARVRDALVAAGVEPRIVQLPNSARTSAEAAMAIGCDVAQIAKSIVFRRTDTNAAVLVITSGSNRVDEKRASREVGAELGKADANFVRAATGFVIGGVPPLAHDTAIEKLIDEDLLRFETIWAAAGTPHAVFAVTPQELIRATGGRIATVAG